MTVNSAEAELLNSDAFKGVVSSEVAQKIRLTAPGSRYKEGHQRLALPKVGQPVVEALRTLAASRSTPMAQSVVAEHLAERIEQRVAHRQGR